MPTIQLFAYASVSCDNFELAVLNKIYLEKFWLHIGGVHPA